MMFKIAIRNIFRNKRRSATTMMTIAIGTAALVLFGAFVQNATLGLETTTVQRSGHLTVYRRGFFDFGAGNAAAWGIPDYERLLALVRSDAVLKRMTTVVTPTQLVTGIVENPAEDTSKTFFGVGFIPSDRDAMKTWNVYGVAPADAVRSGLTDDDTTEGVLGQGLIRVLGLCERTHQAHCPARQAMPLQPDRAAELADLPSRDFGALTEEAGRAGAEGEPRLDLLGATVNGAPNVVTLLVHRVEYQGVKELDENYVGMTLKLAQTLVYGRSRPLATAIVLQLKDTRDLGAARDRLVQLFKAHHLDLEVRDFSELNPFYTQARNLFRSIFSFISVIIAVVALFTIANAMSMSVIERTDEIGTTRALGLRRGGIRSLFLIEGAAIGMLGATGGLLLGYALGLTVNGAGMTWTPPGQVNPIPLRVYLGGGVAHPAMLWAVLTAVATLAAWAPAERAARLSVADALRHV